MRRFLAMCVMVGMVASASALTIDIDYTYDGGYFSTNPAAKTALEKAASDLGAAILPSLSVVTADAFTGTSGATSATFDWAFSFTNPSDAVSTITVPTFTFAADTFRIYAGARVLGGSTLGVGSNVGLSVQLSASGEPSEFVGAMANAESLSNTGLRRGAGPVMSQIAGGASLGGTSASYALNVGAMAGVMAFDTTTDWHFDTLTLPGAEKSDFYSVALHEILHTLGIGTAKTWDDSSSGLNWSGANVDLLTGGGANILSGDGAHIASGTMSTNLYTGLAQEAAMDPSLTQGTRKSLTVLDVAFLQDLGYHTVAVPEPGTLALLALAALGAWGWRRRG